MRSFFIASYSKNIFHGFIIFLVSLTSCDDHLKDVGMEVIDRGTSTGTFKTDTLYADDIERITSFVDSIPVSETNRLYLGTYGSYDFRMLMYFAMPSEEITDENGNVIPVDSMNITENSQIRLVGSKYYGSAGAITAQLHTIQKNWSSSDLYWSRFEKGTDYNTTPASTQTFSALNEFDTVRISVPKDTVIQWLKTRNDTSTTVPKRNRGVIIDFDAASNFIQQFYSARVTTVSGGIATLDFEKAPRLEIKYSWAIDRNKNGVYDGDNEFGSSVFYVAPVFISGVYSGGYHGFVYRDRNPQPVNTITVGGGLPYHSVLKFKTDRLPKNLTINSAFLIMHTDPVGNLYRTTGDSIVIRSYFSLSDTSDWKAGEMNVDEAISSSDNTRDDTLRLNISDMLQSWATNPKSNLGLMLTNQFSLNGNFNPLYRVRFYNNPSDRDNSPKIIIYYTQSPQ